MRRVLLGLGAVAALSGCEKPLTAPGNTGVCWRMADGMNGKPDFRPVAPNIDTLENCAVRLEGIRMAYGQPVTGAFQGRFIYVTDQEVSAASGPKSQRYRVFTPAQRLEVQKGIQTLMAREKAGG
ncbi:MAG: lipoprotein [Pseudomonadota bacterium]|uniref:lipoprotein n=1 Tax=Phenylobacterium sp. TaxID=1871053 RepID=UPI0025E5E2A2|nr:lipoprotein [Phenylobacterium sp.]MBT9469603.1 membrane lipoprotein lipid attachment site-containing protein [Phenylobacterium sp.]